MKRFFILFGVLSMISCQQENHSRNKNVLFNINHSNKLKIVNIDAKCGEWGGDEKQIIFYRDDFKSQLLADYLEKEKNCNHIPESKITKSVKRIKITDEDGDLIIKIINELTKNKLNKEPIFSHSGIYNSIILSDSTIIINDFPSIELKNFNILINKITRK